MPITSDRKSPANTVIIITGPTASGKTKLAFDIAQNLNGLIINADSLQIYKDLKVLTARPDLTMTNQIPHKLYGIIAYPEICSAGQWCEKALNTIDKAFQQKFQPILVGGTGFYIKALIEGLAPIPKIPHHIQESILENYQQFGLNHLYHELQTLDPEASYQIHANDSYRIMRALMVIKATNQSILTWHSYKNSSLKYSFKIFCLLPERAVLYKFSEQRLRFMIENGGLEEAKAIDNLNINYEHPLMKTLGLKELITYLHHSISFEDAILKASQRTRNYIKRQYTWFRHQLKNAFFLERDIKDRSYFNMLQRDFFKNF
ncbi:MAG: tRNA (adenosine(37)-N6)-dimethylallyltransferase MiaA [Alphaproteobacteria bacterium]|nr:tRNA (adenosine(37)-N6)-dimethylallyltransferase MiaA [Alphaproteobacteria bacterium]